MQFLNLQFLGKWLCVCEKTELGSVWGSCPRAGRFTEMEEGRPGTTLGAQEPQDPEPASEAHIRLKGHPQSGGRPQSPTSANPNAPPMAHGSAHGGQAAPHRGILLGHREERSSDAATTCRNRKARCYERGAGREKPHTAGFHADGTSRIDKSKGREQAGGCRGWGRKGKWLPVRMGALGGRERSWKCKLMAVMIAQLRTHPD